MSDWKLPWTGHCRCGETQVRITEAPLLAMACHCTGCQTMSASAYSLSLAIPESGFVVTAGEPVIGGLHGPVRHYFCPRCMSWMFTRPQEGGYVNLRPTMLDDHRWFEPYVEFWTEEKLGGAATAAVHSYPRTPAVEDIPRLVAEYAQRGRRPG